MANDNSIYGFGQQTAIRLWRQSGKKEGTFDPSKVGGAHKNHAVFLAPISGVPSVTGASPVWTPGTATCAVMRYVDSTTIQAVDSNETQTVRNLSTAIPAGTLFVGHKIGGVWTVSGSSDSSSTAFTLFTLTSNLAATVGATATASMGGGSITVVNSGEFRAYTGAQGLAVRLGDGSYWVIFVNQPAQRVYAVLDAHPTSDRYGADPREANCAIQDFPAPYALTPFPFSWMPSTFATTLANPDHLFGESGDGCLLVWDKAAAGWRLAEVYPQRQQRLWVQLYSNRPNGLAESVPFNAHTPASHGLMPADETELDDIFNVLIGGKTDDYAYVAWDADTQKYIAIEGQHQATRVKGTLNGSFSASPATFSVTVVTGMDGYSPSGPITVQNRYAWPSGTSGAKIDVLWDTVAGEWYPAQMEWTCPA